MALYWPACSHFCCSFHGRLDSWPVLSEMSCGCGLLAHEAKTNALIPRRMSRRGSERDELRASINDDISRLYLDATRQAVGNDIADSGSWFNR